MPIIDIQRRLAEAGRIRIGEQIEIKSGKSAGKKRPARLGAFRLTSSNERSLQSLAKTYGGEVKPWADAPVGTQWELFTDADELNVLVPPSSMSFSQWYELWSGGGCQRRCDGQRNSILESECICDPEDRECKPHTRLSVMLAELPTSGMWRLDTQGYYAASELSGAFELAQMVSTATGASILRGHLRLEQREVKRPDQPSNKFVVPVLQFDLQINEAIQAPAGLIPIGESSVGDSLGSALTAIEGDVERKPRANSAPPIPATTVSRSTRIDESSVVDVESSVVESSVVQTTDSAFDTAYESLMRTYNFATSNEEDAAKLAEQWGRTNLPFIDDIQTVSQCTLALALVNGVLNALSDTQSNDEGQGDEEFEQVTRTRTAPSARPLDADAATKSRSKSNSSTSKASTNKPASAKQTGYAHSLLSKSSVDKEHHYEIASKIIGRQIESFTEMNSQEISSVIDLFLKGDPSPFINAYQSA
jgi:hypothetical protein